MKRHPHIVVLLMYAVACVWFFAKAERAFNVDHKYWTALNGIAGLAMGYQGGAVWVAYRRAKRERTNR